MCLANDMILSIEHSLDQDWLMVIICQWHYPKPAKLQPMKRCETSGKQANTFADDVLLGIAWGWEEGVSAW